MIQVLVTGAQGQLGKTLQKLVYEQPLPSYNFYFVSKQGLDISNSKQTASFFQQNAFDYCINCAAYTAVDQAEEEAEQAFLMNATGPKNLAEACKIHGVVFIHISTDFVFEGNTTVPFTETDIPNPMTVYGASKLQGEKHIQAILDTYFIIRTSWLYSEFGMNFVKTMRRLGQEKTELHVVDDQLGSPTYAHDLAEVLLHIVKSDVRSYGIYHYSNAGVVSWYDFAKEIMVQSSSKTRVLPVHTSGYPTKATRPKYSVLNTSKIQDAFGVEIPNWRNSLKILISSFE